MSLRVFLSLNADDRSGGIHAHSGGRHSHRDDSHDDDDDYDDEDDLEEDEFPFPPKNPPRNPPHGGKKLLAFFNFCVEFAFAC